MCHTHLFFVSLFGNYMLSKSYNYLGFSPEYLNSDKVNIMVDDKGNYTIDNIEFSKNKVSNYDIRMYTRSEYYKLIVDNNDLTEEEIKKIYNIDKRAKKVTYIVLICMLLIAVMGVIMVVSVSGELSMVIAGGCILLMLFTLILIITSKRRTKKALSNKPEKIIRIEVVDVLDELDGKTIIFKDDTMYYVYYSNSDICKVGKAFSININKYRRPKFTLGTCIKNYVCSKLNGFTDEDFHPISSK